MRALLIFLTACGRLSFDAVTTQADGGTDAGTDGPPLPTSASSLPCETVVDLGPIGGTGSLDFLAWVVDSAGDFIVASQHQQDNSHPLRRFAVSFDGTTFAAADDGLVASAADPWLAVFEPVAGGVMLGYVDSPGQAYTALLGPGLVPKAAAKPIATMSRGLHSFVRVPGLGLMIGGSVFSGIGVVTLGEDGEAIQATTISDASVKELLSITPMADGYAVAWVTSTDDCQIAVFGADHQMRAGPIALGITAGYRPRITWNPTTGRLAVVVGRSDNVRTYVGTWDENLDPVLPLMMLPSSSLGADLLVDRDGFLVISTPSSQLSVLRIAQDLTIDVRGPYSTVVSGANLSLVSGEHVAVWGTFGSRLAALRTCF